MGGGLGHLTRALALTRAATRRGIASTVVTNSPWASELLARTVPPAGAEVVVIPASARAMDVRPVLDALGRVAFERWVVDTFPRGLADELPPPAPGCPRVLVHRDLHPDHLRDHLGWIDATYDLVLGPGERGPLADHPRAVHTAPWLIRDHDELPSPAEVRARLSLGACAVLVVGTGRPGEVRLAGRIATELAVAFPDVDVRWATLGDAPPFAPPPLQHHPLLELMGAFDAVVGAGGYHTVYEARAAAAPLLALAQPRRFDRQARRLRPEERVQPDTLVRRLAEVLATPRPLPGPFPNGVHEAVRAIVAGGA